MYLRHTTIRKDGKLHRYWRLVRSVRVGRRVIQQTVAHLGELDEHGRVEARALARRLIGSPEQTALFDDGSAQLTVPVRLKGIRIERSRQFGDVYLALALWRGTGLEELCQQVLPAGQERIAWAKMAAVLVAARFCEPSSELHIAENWYRRTALSDLLQLGEEEITKDRLYRGLDHLLVHKAALEAHLSRRCGELFAIQNEVLLYDVTSTYFEGQAEANPQAQRGYSRDHRPDCEQMVIALIVNSEGFPFSYETFDGNRADVSTMETILRMVERKYGQARRIWVLDRGIVSEENLQAIRKRGGQYLVGTPRSQMKQFEEELLKDDWTRVRPEVEVKKVAVPQGEETYILCRTAGRKEKEKAIRNRFSTRMEDALKRLAKTIETGRLKDRNKMERRLGRIQAQHSQVNDLYEVDLRDTPEGVRLHWEIKEDRKVWRGLREGAYMLRTNLQAGTAEELWSRYMQLTEAEASFRALKSELSIRPLFHQKEPRVKAHVMVAFLGYALWVTLKHLLKRRPALVPQPSDSGVNNAKPLSALKALALLSTLQSADIILPTTDGREIRLRRITEPTAEQKSLLQQLGLCLPVHFELNRKCSADSATA
jgi:transposase